MKYLVFLLFFASSIATAENKIELTLKIYIPEGHKQSGVKGLHKIAIDLDDGKVHNLIKETGTTKFNFLNIKKWERESINTYFDSRFLLNEENAVVVQIKGQTGTPAGLPTINWNFYIAVNKSDKFGMIQAQHDGYPAYEIYASDELIYQNMPKSQLDVWKLSGKKGDIKRNEKFFLAETMSVEEKAITDYLNTIYPSISAPTKGLGSRKSFPYIVEDNEHSSLIGLDRLLKLGLVGRTETEYQKTEDGLFFDSPKKVRQAFRYLYDVTDRSKDMYYTKISPFGGKMTYFKVGKYELVKIKRKTKPITTIAGESMTVFYTYKTTGIPEDILNSGLLGRNRVGENLQGEAILFNTNEGWIHSKLLDK